MSGFCGTPGPWQVCNGTDVFTPLRARNAAGVASAHNDGWHIADCDMGETQTDEGPATLSHAEKRANARLIAAAPALLEALVDVIGWVPSGGPWATDAPLKSLERARAAIRQATEGEGNYTEALAQQPAACDMGDLCIGCEPRNADGSCPDQQPAAVDGGSYDPNELLRLAMGLIRRGHSLANDAGDEVLVTRISDHLAAQPGGSDNGR